MKDSLNHAEAYRYQLLSRLQQDCDYFLGYGNRCEKHLWSLNAKDQIADMKALHNSFPDNKKPEWLSMEQIEEYEKQMLDLPTE